MEEIGDLAQTPMGPKSRLGEFIGGCIGVPSFALDFHRLLALISSEMVDFSSSEGKKGGNVLEARGLCF
jgi:hypothetical protein